MHTKTNIYISDLLAVPLPKHASSHEDFLRRIRNRRILWGLLPYMAQGLIGLLTCGLVAAGAMTLMLGLGG